MSSPTSSVSHLSATDSSGEQIYSMDSYTEVMQSRMTNVGLPLQTFYGSKHLPSSDSPSKNLRVRKLDFGGHSPDSDLESLSPVSSPVDDSDDDQHWRPQKASFSI